MGSTYICPICSWDPYEGALMDEPPYFIDGKPYPKISNYVSNSWEPGHSWKETHYCSNCKKEFSFGNCDY